MTATSFGEHLRAWRKRRRYTQLDLAGEVEISTRHLSCLETGRSNPSREMVLLLGRALQVPLQDRNAMLLAAGYAPTFRSRGLEGEDAEPICQALFFMLRRHQPYPAVLVDPGWTVMFSNEGYARLLAELTGQNLEKQGESHIHDDTPVRGSYLLIPLFDPDRLRPAFLNYTSASGLLLSHLRRVASDDPRAQATLDRILAFGPEPEVIAASSSIVIPLVLSVRDTQLSLFSTMTMLGTANDTMLSELRLETYFAADEESDRRLRAITSG